MGDGFFLFVFFSWVESDQSVLKLSNVSLFVFETINKSLPIFFSCTTLASVMFYLPPCFASPHLMTDWWWWTVYIHVYTKLCFHCMIRLGSTCIQRAIRTRHFSFHQRRYVLIAHGIIYFFNSASDHAIQYKMLHKHTGTVEKIWFSFAILWS